MLSFDTVPEVSFLSAMPRTTVEAAAAKAVIPSGAISKSRKRTVTTKTAKSLWAFSGNPKGSKYTRKPKRGKTAAKRTF